VPPGILGQWPTVPSGWRSRASSRFARNAEPGRAGAFLLAAFADKYYSLALRRLHATRSAKHDRRLYEYAGIVAGAYSANPRDPGIVKALLALLDSVPDELFQLPPADYADLVKAREQIRQGLETGGQWRPFTGAENLAIKKLYELLIRCPDEVPAPGTTDPVFITDYDLRAELHRDLGELNRALQNGEWKSATVLAGSIVEAFLLWGLQNRKTEAEIRATAASLGKVIDLTKRPLERWELYELIEYAHATNLISPSTRAAADQGRDFRNLIHPGRVQRLAKKCNRSTALLGAGAAEAVIADLS